MAEGEKVMDIARYKKAPLEPTVETPARERYLRLAQLRKMSKKQLVRLVMQLEEAA